jgi:hypothetical protein
MEKYLLSVIWLDLLGFGEVGGKRGREPGSAFT